MCSSSFNDCISSLELCNSSFEDMSSSLLDCNSSLVVLKSSTVRCRFSWTSFNSSSKAVSWLYKSESEIWVVLTAFTVRRADPISCNKINRTRAWFWPNSMGLTVTCTTWFFGPSFKATWRTSSAWLCRSTFRTATLKTTANSFGTAFNKLNCKRLPGNFRNWSISPMPCSNW